MIRNGLIVIGVVALLQLTLNYAETLVKRKNTPPEYKFKVVDQYGPCEVIRYDPDLSAKYVYFLDCK